MHFFFIYFVFQQMAYKCRLLYARGLSIQDVNGPINQLAQNLKFFLAGCEETLQGKIRGKILQYFNPMIDLGAQKNIQHQGEDKTTVCNHESTVQNLLNNCKSCDYDRQLALLKSQIDGMQRQAPVIGRQLETFGQKLALAESALRGQQRQLVFQTVFPTHHPRLSPSNKALTYVVFTS